MSGPELRNRHRTGLNVASGDGSAYWVDTRSVPLKASLDTLPYSWNGSRNIRLLTRDNTLNAAGLWTFLDKTP